VLEEREGKAAVHQAGGGEKTRGRGGRAGIKGNLMRGFYLYICRGNGRRSQKTIHRRPRGAGIEPRGKGGAFTSIMDMEALVFSNY